jgi:hypothetical protein
LKHNFLVDENLVIAGGEYEALATDLWLAIAENCHHVGMDGELRGKYLRKLNAASGGGSFGVAGSMLLSVVSGVMAREDKAVWPGPIDAEALTGLVADEDDRFLVPIALGVATHSESKQCVLITTDARTRADFCRPEMNNLGISGVSPEVGIELARQPRA